MDQLLALGSADPGTVARCGGGLAIEGHRHLQDHKWQPRARVFAKRLGKAACCGGLSTGGESDLHPAVSKNSGATASSLLTRIVRGDHNTADTRFENRLHARRLPPLMSTGLKRHVHGRSSRALTPLPTISQRRPLSMQSTQLSMKPLADHHPATHNNSSNQGVGTHSTAPVLRKLQSPLQMRLIRGS